MNSSKRQSSSLSSFSSLTSLRNVSQKGLKSLMPVKMIRVMKKQITAATKIVTLNKVKMVVDQGPLLSGGV